MSFYSVEQWTIKDVAQAFTNETGDQSNRKIVIPIFQRGLRWEDARRTQFIDSLNKGYPFGSLLFAKQSKPNTYSVVDGLQRGTTVCDYVYNPLSKNNITNIDDDVLTEIRLALFPGNMNTTINEKIQSLILDYFHDKKTFDNIDLFELSDCILDKIPTARDKYSCLKSINGAILPFYNKKKKVYENICSAVVPIIVYSGPNELLSEIFNRINVKGIPLNNYEIYAAIWQQDKRVINCKEIVNKVIAKYVSLTKNNYEIDGFDANLMLKEQKLTAFEYLFGLGKYWWEKYDCLKVETSNDDDKVNEISFEIFDSCLSDTKNIANLDKIIFNYNVNKLQKRIEEAINFVSNAISVVCEFKGNKRKFNVLHSKYQIVSLISYTFRQMYDVNNLEKKRDGWQSLSDEYEKSLLSHYVADIISNEWHDGGASKVYTVLRDNRYMDEITKTRWESLLDNYYQNQLSNKQAERFSSPANADSIILNCIYMNIFTANDQLSTKKFDIEHLATKEKMKKILSKCDGLKLPVSCIANYCYLPEDINRGKKDKTIYENNKFSMTITEIESKFSFTSQQEFDWIFKNYDSSNAGELSKSYYEYLEYRYSILREKFLKSFGF